MSASFGPLSHDDVRADIDRVERVIQGMYLTNKRHAGVLYTLGVRARVREGKHHRARMPFERHIEQSRILRNSPGDEPDSDVGSSYLCRFGFKPNAVDITATQQSESSSRSYR